LSSGKSEAAGSNPSKRIWRS